MITASSPDEPANAAFNAGASSNRKAWFDRLAHHAMSVAVDLAGMQRHPQPDPFDLLRRASQDLNVKLADLARTIAIRHIEVDGPEH